MSASSERTSVTTRSMSRRFEEVTLLEIKIIRNEADYDAALARIDVLFGAEPGTPEGAELDRLVTLVSDYEDIHYPIPEPVKAPDENELVRGYEGVGELGR